MAQDDELKKSFFSKNFFVIFFMILFLFYGVILLEKSFVTIAVDDGVNLSDPKTFMIDLCNTTEQNVSLPVGVVLPNLSWDEVGT